MRFSAKLFALAALSVYNNFIETVKTLSFDLKREINTFSEGASPL